MKMTDDLVRDKDDFIPVRINYILSPNDSRFIRYHLMTMDDYYDNNTALSLAHALNRAYQSAVDIGDEELKIKLLKFYKMLSNLNDNPKMFSNWWQLIGKSELNENFIDRRNICHDWQFTDEQDKFLIQYYAANLLLVECMNRSYVNKEVREEIESTMLLPSVAVVT